MKKTLLYLVSGALLVSSCGTYTGQGAAIGGQFGSILGSAIGGISGGWRGSDIGTIVGMAGGAAVGAAIGAAADRKQEEQLEQYRAERSERIQRSRAKAHEGVSYNNGYDNSSSYGGGYDNSSSDYGYGDDCISFDGAGPSGSRDNGYSAVQPRAYDPTTEPVGPGYSVRYNAQIEIRNARLIDADRDGVLRAGEECKITFEVMNRSSRTLYDVQPTVVDVTGNRHIHISPNLHVESIAPNSGVRYTASILADSRLRDGRAVIRVGVTQGNRQITSQVKEFTVETRRR